MCVVADGFIAGGADNRRRFARDWAGSGLAGGREDGATSAILAPCSRAVKPVLCAAIFGD